MKLKTAIKLPLVALAAGAAALAFVPRAGADAPYLGSTFGDVWSQVASDPYASLPHTPVTLGHPYLAAINPHDIIHVTLTPEAFLNTPVGAVVAQAFATADRTLDVTQTLIRQLYPIAELGEADPSNAVAPPWMMITGSSD